MKSLLLFGLLVFGFNAIAEEAVLRYAADSEGGAPYIFQDPLEPTRLIGYEVDLMNALAEEMGRKPVYLQNQWDGLIPGLERGDYDVAINGIEITPDRKEKALFADPYYITYEKLMVKKDEYAINSLDDCVGRKVGTLKGTLAERILRAKGGIDVVTYDSQVTPYEDMAIGRLDAVLMDAPITLYGGELNTQLKVVGGPIGRMEYGIALAKGNTELQQEINAALNRLRANGKLRAIYDRWGLWNEMMAERFNDFGAAKEPPTAYQYFLEAMKPQLSWAQRLQRYYGMLPLLLHGAWMTLEISILAMVGAVLFGLVLALMRLYGPKPVVWAARAYIELVRGTPLLLQLYVIFYGLPNLGIKLDPFFAAIIGLALNYAAYEAENYRTGVQAVAKGQAEAAQVLGMTRAQGLRHVVLPQAIRLVIPPITNDFISLLKDSSLVSVITLVELTKVYGQLAATYYDFFGIGLIVAALYFGLGLPFVRLAGWAEKKFNMSHSPDRRPAAAIVPEMTPAEAR